MDKPLAIDLFCGLSQPKFCRCANAAIKELVTCRAENPNHMWLCVGYQAPSPVAFMRWLVCDLKDTVLAARLARTWHLWPSFCETIERQVFEIALLLVERSALLVFSRRPYSAQLTACFVRAGSGAIAPVRAWRNNIKMRPAFRAITAVICRSLMFMASDSTRALCAIIAAPFGVRSLGFERGSTQLANQIVHRKIIS